MISILCPTRGRPNGALLTRTSAEATAGGDIEVLFGVDSDDPARPEYEGLGINYRLLAPDGPMGGRWNELARLCSGDVFFLGNDDLHFQTHDWDLAVKEATAVYDDEIYVAWPNDGINGERHCAFPFVSRRFASVVGSFVPECFKFFYHDTWLFDLGRRINRLVYMPDVFIEHLHFTKGKSKYDETYRRNRGNGSQLDKATFEMNASLRAQQADKLRGAMK